ncbi:MAG TPA: hypothetical protein VFC34_13420, partial [Puia sp.]|nr:hypothetical protein [Puia sp.]
LFGDGQTIKSVRLLFVSLCLVFFSLQSAKAQSLALQRANSMGMGINLSWLENYWNGTKANDFQD